MSGFFQLNVKLGIKSYSKICFCVAEVFEQKERNLFMLEKGGFLKGHSEISPDLSVEAGHVANEISAPIVHIPRFESSITLDDYVDEPKTESKPVRILPNITFRQISGPWRPLREGEEVHQEDIDIINGLPHVPIRKRDA